MSAATVDMLLMIWGLFSLGLVPVLSFLLRQAYKGGARLGLANGQPSDSLTKAIDTLAQTVASYANEYATNWINSLRAKGLTDEEVEEQKLSGAAKKEIAISALQKLAPAAGVKLSNEQAEIAIEAAVQRQRSLLPPASEPPAGTVYQSVAPGSASLALTMAEREALANLHTLISPSAKQELEKGGSK